MQPAPAPSSKHQQTWSQEAPRVSVLVRTVGRESLNRAVKSVLTQMYSDWELVVLNAGGDTPLVLDSGSYGGRLRVIEPDMPLNKSAAANALLFAAKGKYGIFLDDDDWLLAEHLQKLVRCLDKNSWLVAAYSDIQCATLLADGTLNVSHVFDQDFDAIALQLKNYLPIHSVMFRVGAVNDEPACRFFDGLQLFEDWDFWLQLASKGPFERVPGVSAVYCLSDTEGSGHANSASLHRNEMLSVLGQRQIERWRGEDVAGFIEQQASMTNALVHERQVGSVWAEQHKMLVQKIEAVGSSERKLLLEAVERERALNDALSQVVKRDALVSHKVQELYSLETSHTQLKTEMSWARTELNRVNTELNHVRSELSQVNARTEVLNAYSQIQQVELAKLENLRSELWRQIDALTHSASWRITYPYRWIRQFPGRILATQKRVLALRVLGAVRGEVVKFGFRGFLRRVPTYWQHRKAYAAVISSRPASTEFFAVARQTGRPSAVRLHPDLLEGVVPLDHSVSVVIPTMDAGPEFVFLLRKLKQQQGIRNIEIVIVDSGSKDDTVHIAKQFGVKVVQIRADEFTHSYSRNLGADHASGDYLLFMVQDAYPIGDHWLHGMLRYVLDHESQGVVAASCAEYSRGDSDMMYDSMIHTHYTFLGCLERDRVGEYAGSDHMSLRSKGQLSDVSCLIGAKCFGEYRYRGNYAEDLDLGVRLIRDGKKVAMLAHVKVVHSHNRPAHYYLKRSFVDVIFLVGMFDDFLYPNCVSLEGLVRGIEASASLAASWIKEAYSSQGMLTVAQQVATWLAIARKDGLSFDREFLGGLGDSELDAYVGSLRAAFSTSDRQTLTQAANGEAIRFFDTFLARLEHFNQFAVTVYGNQDQRLTAELKEVIAKTFASAAGAALAFFCLDHVSNADPLCATANKLRHHLEAGV